MKYPRSTLLFLSLYWSTVSVTYAQATTSVAFMAPVQPGERLSDWMWRNVSLNTDTTALHWQATSERSYQYRLQQAVVQMLSHNSLSELLANMPVTGRLTLLSSDMRVLQANPAQDPLLREGHTVQLFQRPRHVALLNTDGSVCLVPHHPYAVALDYVRHCRGQIAAEKVDWAWLAQPDGRTSQVALAPWNLAAQDAPAPGAWIWAPEHISNIDAAVSDNLTRFLATQHPAEFTNIPVSYLEPMELRQPHQTVAALSLTASDWGEIGLLQTPTARMAPTGNMRFHLSQVSPYTRGTVMFQPLDWVEAGFRYTDVANRLYGPEIAGDQSYKDKSIDFKFRLVKEDALWPQLAVGLRDAGGTGLFSSEYVVASKRWGNWDASLGLAWGNMGARGNIKNPLSFLDEKFASRPEAESSQGGTANTLSFFRGPAALFGGVQWQTPYSPWIAKVELDGNNYLNEPQANNQLSNSSINLGVVYRYSPSVDFSAAIERGDKWMFGLTLHEQLNRLKSPKLLDPVLPDVRPEPPAVHKVVQWSTLANSLAINTGWTIRSIHQQHNSTIVEAEVDNAVHLQERVDRAITVLHQHVPASALQFVFQLVERGMPMTRIEIDRAEWVARRTQPVEPSRRMQVQQAMPANDLPSSKPEWRNSVSRFKPDVSPSFSYVLGGPDNFFLYQLGVKGSLKTRLSDSTWIDADVNLRLSDNYDNFKYDAPSNLPRVRTYQREYVTSSRVNIPNLQITHAQSLGANHYVSAYAGLLESMYGGMGAEWLYRPWRSPLAFGVDVNHVRQRGFKQDLSFRDYQVNTGHATMYWDTGWNDIQINLSAGRYLAGDTGSTLGISRSFSNGVTLGAWATKTMISEEQFGEGSFDKGIYIFIPFDVLLPISTGNNSVVVWTPLTRDGGAKLSRRFGLFDFTRQRDRRALQWASVKDVLPQTAEDRSYILQSTPRNALQRLGETTSMLGGQISNVPASTWWLAGGAILGSSLLDREMDKRLSSAPNADGTYPKSSTSNIPLLMAMGTGLLYTGVAGEGLSTTAETSMTAAAYTLGANLATRYVVGRSRPFEDKGPTDFHGFTANSVNSGFASNHVAIAFALATPFAQQYDMPWLYGAAALTAVGRMQQREHWMSDTVAGAFMGYAMGSLLSEQQLGRKKSMRLNATPQSVTATWSF